MLHDQSFGNVKMIIKTDIKREREREVFLGHALCWCTSSCVPCVGLGSPKDPLRMNKRVHVGIDILWIYSKGFTVWRVHPLVSAVEGKSSDKSLSSLIQRGSENCNSVFLFAIHTNVKKVLALWTFLLFQHFLLSITSFIWSNIVYQTKITWVNTKSRL